MSDETTPEVLPTMIVGSDEDTEPDPAEIIEMSLPLGGAKMPRDQGLTLQDALDGRFRGSTLTRSSNRRGLSASGRGVR